MVRKPHNRDPKFIQKLGSLFIFAYSIFGEMVLAIAFDIERKLMAKKVAVEGRDWMLATKLCVGATSIAQELPKQLFAGLLATSQFTREFDGA